MSNDTAALLHALYTAYREKRLADVMAHLDPDFRFVVHLPEAALPRRRQSAQSRRDA